MCVLFSCPFCSSELTVKKDGSLYFQCNACKNRSNDYFEESETEAYQEYVKTSQPRIKKWKNEVEEPKKKEENRQSLVDDMNRLLEPQKITQEYNKKKESVQEEPKSIPDEETTDIFQTKEEHDKVRTGKTLDSFLKDVFDDGFEQEKFELLHIIQKESTTGEFASEESSKIVNEKLKKLLIEKKRWPLYRHQIETLEKSMNGNDIIINAPTSSGKTISFLLPILNHILNSGSKRLEALITYPTKALTSDQYSEIIEYANALDITIAQIDGNVGKDEEFGRVDHKQRLEILDTNPQIILTNLDFIRAQMVNHNGSSTKFNELVTGFKFLIIDEVHEWKEHQGIIASLFLMQMRHYYLPFQIIGASATIDNPETFASSLFHKPVELVQGSGKRGRMTISMLYPGEKYSQRDVIVDVLGKLTSNGHRSLSFSNTRMGAEEIAQSVSQRKIEIDGKERQIAVKPHRAGLRQEEIDRNENDFKSGKLDVLSSTPTLQVGINIGDLTGVVSEFIQYPTLTQRVGRGGRDGQDCYGFIVLHKKDPISRFYKFHPEHYQVDTLEHIIDSENELLKKINLAVASRVKAFTEKEIEEIENDSNENLFPGHGNAMKELIENEILVKDKKGNFTPTSNISEENLKNFDLRDIGKNVIIKRNGKKLGSWNMPMAFEKLFEGAIYLHNLEVYRCTKFSDGDPPISTVRDTEDHEKHLRTTPKVEITPTIKENVDKSKAFGLDYSLSLLNITKTIREYKEWRISPKNLKNPEDKSQVKFCNNSVTVPNQSTGIVIDLNPVMDKINQSPQIVLEKSAVFHSFEHLLIHAGNMVGGGVSGDVDGITLSNENKIIIYDQSSNGGNGATVRLFPHVKDLIQRADEIVKLCKCEDGCDKCIHSYSCHKFNDNLTKSGVKTLLKILLGRDTFVDKFQVSVDWEKKIEEDEHTEFKSSIQIDVKKYDGGERNIQKLRNKNLIENIVKTICGFGNANGGELIIGKRDDGTIFGLEHDMELLKEPNVDQLKNHLINIFTTHIKDTGFISKLTVTTKTVDSKTICLVKVPPRGKNAIFTSENIFYVRLLTATRKLDAKELLEYTKENFS